MKSERVTQAWEFYHDNCPGFKEPMRKQFRRLDEYVFSIEAENAKLRELLRQVVEYVHKEHLPHEDISFWSDRDNGVFRRMRELGIEAE